VHDEPSPAAGAGEVLVRVTAVGLCGSDRHWFEEAGIGDAVLTQPLVLGHEFVGVIEGGSRAGERVAVDPAIPCARCATCLAGQSHLCLEGRFAGHGVTDGALRARLAWPAELAHALPDSLSDVEATLLEPLGVALHALDLGHVQAGTTAGVFGCGPVGLLLIQALHAAGASAVVANDVLPHRLEAAVALGATPAGAAGDDIVDVAFEASGEDAALDDAIAATRPGGRVVVVGIPTGDRTSFTASTARRKGLTLLLSRRMEAADLSRALRLVESGLIYLEPIVTSRYRLDEWRDAFGDLVRRSGLKVVIEP
jgi:L-iditol 2-dehydrogenase